MGNTSVGDIAIRIKGDMSELSSALGLSSKKISNFAEKSQKKLRKVTGELAKVGAASTAAGAAIVAGLYVKGSQAIDAQAKLARSVGSSVASIQALEKAGDLAGISQDGLANASGKLNARLGEAMRGTGLAAAQLERMGLSADKLSGMDADQRMAVLADRMKALGYNTAQAGDALKQFGIREEQIVGLMIEGGDAFRSARKEVEELGIAVTDIEAAQVEAANDAMLSLKDSITSVSNRIAVSLAPYLTVIGEKFGDLIKDNKGFKSQITSLVNTAIRGFGKFADTLQGLKVVFKGLQLIGVGFKAAMVSVFELVTSAVGIMIDGITSKVNSVIGVLNKLPDVDIATIDPFSNSAFMTGLQKMGSDARNEVGKVRSEMHALAMQDMPSTRVVKFLEDVTDQSKKSAQQIVSARKATGIPAQDAANDDIGGSDGNGISSKLSSIQDSFKSEMVLLQEKAAAQELILSESLAHELITKTEHSELVKNLKQRTEDQITAIEKNASDARTALAIAEAQARKQAVSSMMSNLTLLMNSGSKKLFKVGKLAAISQTVVSTITGAGEAFKSLAGIPIVGPALGAAAAGAAMLAGQQRISAIRSQQFGGGGSGASATGSNTAAVNAATTPVSQSSGGYAGTLRVEGFDPSRLYEGGAIQGFAEALNEHYRNGGNVAWAS